MRSIAGVNIVELDPDRTRASATAACRTPTASSSSTRAACTGRRSAPAASPRIEGVRTPSKVAQLVDGRDRSPPAGRQGRAGIRARDGLQDRRRPQHRELARQRGWNGSGAPIRCTTWIRRSARRPRVTTSRLQMVAEGLIDREHYYGHHQLRRRQRQGRGLRRDDDQRPGVEDSGPRRRFADSRRRPLRRRRRRRRGIDRPRRGESLQPVLVPIVDEMRRGAHPKDAGITALKRVAKNTIEKRLLNADRGQPNFGLNFYCLNKQGRVRRRVDVRLDLRRLHRERRTDAAKPKRCSGTARRR